MRIFFFSILIFSFISAFEWTGKVNWVMSFKIAKDLAKIENKIIMVDVAGTNCPPCKYLATRVYTDDRVANYLNDHFLPVLYFADKDSLPEEVLRHFPRSTPTIMFFDKNGHYLTRFVGARPPQIFLRYLKDIYKKANE